MTKILVRSHRSTLKSVGRDHLRKTLQQIEGCPVSQ